MAMREGDPNEWEGGFYPIEWEGVISLLAKNAKHSSGKTLAKLLQADC